MEERKVMVSVRKNGWCHEISEKNRSLLLSAVFQVFEDYVDDCRNTDNAWVQVSVFNVHLDRSSQVLVDVNNVVRTRTLARRCFGVKHYDGSVTVPWRSLLTGREQL